MHARTARYGYSGNARDVARKAEKGLLPIFEAQPGFAAYTVIDTGGEIVSLSAWASPQDAEAASEAAAKWVAENLPDELALKETKIGEVLFSTALDISSIPRARA